MYLEKRDCEAERKKRLERRDKKEAKYLLKKDGDDNDGAELPEVLIDVSKSARAVEIIGQIVRNRFGSIKIAELQRLMTEGIEVGLRFLQFYITEMKASEDAVLGMIEKILDEHYELTDRELENMARKTYWGMCYANAFAVIEKLSTNIGGAELIPVIDGFLKEKLAVGDKEPAEALVYIMAKLSYEKKIPKDEIRSLAKSLADNPLAFRLLQQVVVQHIYLNHVDYADRQWVVSTLKLSEKFQEKIEADLQVRRIGKQG